MTGNFDDRSWAEAWDTRYGGPPGGARGRKGVRRMSATRLPYLLGSWVLLALVAVPVALLAGNAAPSADVELAGNSPG